MAAPLVTRSGIVNVSDTNFKVSFYIPENCEFSVWDEDKVNYITVQLKDGESQPSSDLIPCDVDYAWGTEAFDLYFEQIISSEKIIKPKIKFEGC